MDIPSSHKEYVADLASEAIQTMTDVAERATQAISTSNAASRDVLTYPSALNAGKSLEQLRASQRAVTESNRHLTREPVLARVRAIDEAEKTRTYYICRTTPVSGVSNLASYRSPVGRLASINIGEDTTLPNGVILELVEKAKFRPVHDRTGWDSEGTEIETEQFGPVPLKSLRKYRQLFDDSRQDDDVLAQIEAEEVLRSSLMAGLQRAVITKMGLRDQPILNSIQDSIFRLPIDRNLILLGPPGTGKTTTLIKRLGQKLDRAYLTEDENSVIDAVQQSNRLPHEESWLMFTPTTLLRLYLKEAFAREQVPASDARIKTWDDYRWDLSKNVFGILRSSTGTGHFVLRPESTHLKVSARTSGILWFEDFYTWQRAEYQRELTEAAESLATRSMEGARLLAVRLQKAISTEHWDALLEEVPRVKGLVDGIKGSTDDKINGALTTAIRANLGFLDELAHYLDTLEQDSDASPDDIEETDTADDDDDSQTALTPRAKAMKRYKDALRARARSLAAKRTQDKAGLNARVMAWIDDRRLSDTELTEVGEQLLSQSYARRFISPVNRYLNGFHRRYSKFRKLRQTEGTWYANLSIEPRDIHPLELDIILLGVLRAAKELLSRPKVVRQLEEPIWSTLRDIYNLYRNQIVVDEATDFSPVQLACMAAIAHPSTRSFFACGDFNQRLTTWGVRSKEEMSWIMTGMEFQEVNIAYRQTRQLNTLARDIVKAVGGSDPIVELPKNVDNEGVRPAFLEFARDSTALSNWLAERLVEIERFLQGQPMPSTAIFVNSEADVKPLADQLNHLLHENNLRVVACLNGQIVGQDSDIRVFDVQHIKGLEFEAVFFVGVDSLAERHPTLFDKYLYVGATRAATYLGLCCDERLPAVIESLRPQFTCDWSNETKSAESARR